MKSVYLILLTALVVPPAWSHEPQFSDRTDLLHIIEAYSERTDTKFVTDPRVKARVNMIGLKLEDVDQARLNTILQMHAFAAYEKDDIVYVIPASSGKDLGQSYGEKWESESKN